MSAAVSPTSAERPRWVAIAARVRRHGLIAAECASLTGARPDDDGIAECQSVELITRAAYVQRGVEVVASAATFDELVSDVAAATFPADRFRIDVHDPSSRLGRPSSATASALADVIPHGPDLDEPQHRFLLAVGADRLTFGEVVAETDASYRRHDAKPWTTSSSLDGRFARALVNLVPEARSLLDPCCGAGSIVLEAASLGLDAFGVDWKPAMVGMTTENLAHFGYAATVVRADARDHVRHVDAIVTDLPYGHAIDADEATIRSIFEHGVDLAPTAVYVAPADFSMWLRSAGYHEVELWTVRKRAGFTRWVHVARV